MKIPETIRIQGVDYNVELEDVCVIDNNVAFGYADFPNCRIALSDSACPNHQTKCLTLWHEIFHCMCYASGMHFDNEEEVVEMFARGTYQILQDNAHEFYDIVDEVDFEEQDQGTCIAAE